MRIYRNIDNLPQFTSTVVTIGSFDGVHHGHLQLFHKIKKLASEIGGQDVVVTFDPHPRSVLSKQPSKVQLLTTIDEKIERLREIGISNLVIVPFNEAFSKQSAEDYIENFIIRSFSPSYLVIGYDHRFGLNRTGDFNLLKTYEDADHFKLVKIEEQQVKAITISSTQIRTFLTQSNIEEANTLLGYNYTLSGVVVKGKQIGKGIGFPTANIRPTHDHKLIPGNGIYAVHIYIEKDRYKGMLYIGQRPSLNDENETSIEVNIFDFEQDIYDEVITIEFIAYLRGDTKFESLDELSDQLQKDKVVASEVLQAQKNNHQNQDKASKKTAAVVLNYNGEQVLPQYLPSLYTSSSDFDLIVIDNASTDESVKYLASIHPNVKLISLGHNHGFAGGYNQGLKGLNYEYLALVNSDIRGTEGWLQRLVNYLDQHPNTAAVMPKIKSDRTHEYFEYAGACGGFIDSLGYPYCRGRIFDTVEIDHGQYDNTINIDWATGAALVFRRDVFELLEGFDETFFAHQEEIDLCLRAKALGHDVAVVPESTVYHLGGATLDYNNPRKTFLNFRNNLALILKNYSYPIPIILIRLILDGLAGIQFLLNGNGKSTIAIIKAHMAFYRRIPSILEKRKKLKLLVKEYKGNSPSPRQGIKSVLYSYYFKGKKHFSDLYGLKD